MRSKLSLGNVTKYTCCPSKSNMGGSLNHSIMNKGIESSGPLRSILYWKISSTQRWLNQIHPGLHITDLYVANQPDPRLDPDGNVAFILQCQLWFYSLIDKPEVQQIVLTGSIMETILQVIYLTSGHGTIWTIIYWHFFLCLRSCKYLLVSSQWKMKALLLHNICFYKGTTFLLHSDTSLHLADTVSVTFEEQKFDTKNDII
jgi:hypothetical protein